MPLIKSPNLQRSLWPVERQPMSIERIASQKDPGFVGTGDYLDGLHRQIVNAETHNVGRQRIDGPAQSADENRVDLWQLQFLNDACRDYGPICRGIDLGRNIANFRSVRGVPNRNQDKWRWWLKLSVVAIADHERSPGSSR